MAPVHSTVFPLLRICIKSVSVSSSSLTGPLVVGGVISAILVVIILIVTLVLVVTIALKRSKKQAGVCVCVCVCVCVMTVNKSNMS